MALHENCKQVLSAKDHKYKDVHYPLTIWGSNQPRRESPNKEINLLPNFELLTSRQTKTTEGIARTGTCKQNIGQRRVTGMNFTSIRTVNPDTIYIRVPFHFAKRGGRKEMLLPEDACGRPDSTLIKTLARAFRWKRKLESGAFATITELAEREGIAPS